MATPLRCVRLGQLPNLRLVTAAESQNVMPALLLRCAAGETRDDRPHAALSRYQELIAQYPRSPEARKAVLRSPG